MTLARGARARCRDLSAKCGVSHPQDPTMGLVQPEDSGAGGTHVLNSDFRSEICRNRQAMKRESVHQPFVLAFGMVRADTFLNP